MLIVEDLKVSFETIYAVQGVSFQVHEGETIGIVGESGSGKTTTFQAITGLIKGIVEGHASFDGGDVPSALGKKIGMIFQSPMSSLNPTMRVGAQIAEGIIFHKLTSKKQALERTLELLTLVGMEDCGLRYPHELSGGQRQRVAIAIALACNPRLLIADEPTTALDALVQTQILDLIQDIQKKLRMSLILISHDLTMVGQICDRVLVFYNGKIVEQGSAKEILQRPKHPYTQMLLASRRAIKTPFQPTTCLMTVNNVTKHFPTGKKVFYAVEDVSLDIRKGEVLGLVGESGSGKSTLGKMLLGLIKPDYGEIRFEGAENKNLFRKIQMIFQDPYSSLNPRMRIEDILAEPTRIHGLPNRVDELLRLVALPPEAKKRYPHEFSGGQRQRIGIARALALNPELLICDEPLSSLDVSIQSQIMKLLLTLKNELGLTLLFISHDLRVVRAIADRIAVMKNGKIVEIGDAEILCENPQHPYTRALFSHVLQKITLQGALAKNFSN